MISAESSVWNGGKEVTGQPQSFLLKCGGVLVTILFLPVLTVLHFALVTFGRRGFYQRTEEDGSLSVDFGINSDSFKRR